MVGVLLHELHLVAHLLDLPVGGRVAFGERLLPLGHLPIDERHPEQHAHQQQPSRGGGGQEHDQLLGEPRLKAQLRPVGRRHIQGRALLRPPRNALHSAEISWQLAAGGWRLAA